MLLAIYAGEKVFKRVVNKKIKLIIFVVITFILILTIFGGLNIYKSCRIINAQEKKNFVSSINILRKSFNRYFRTAEEETEHCRQMIEITVDNQKLKKIAPIAYKYDKNNVPYLEDYMDKILSPVLLYSSRHVEGLQGIYFDFDHEYVISNDLIGRWYTYSSKDRKLHSIDSGKTSTMFPETRKDLEWFYLPRKLKHGLWSKPYLDSDLKMDMISYTAPVYSHNKFLGVIGIDISMDRIKEYIYNFHEYKTGNIYLINSENKIIFAKDYKSDVSTATINRDLYDFINKKYLINSDIKKESSDVDFLKTKSTLYGIMPLYNKFILVVGVSNSELYGEIDRLIFFTSCSLILAVLTALLVSIRAYSIVKKINEELMHKEKLISMGKMTAEIAHEINNPLGYISCNIDTIAKYLKKIRDFMYASKAELYNTSIEASFVKALENIEDIKSDMKIGFILDSIDEIIDETKEGLKKVSNVVFNLKNFAQNYKHPPKTKENLATILDNAFVILGNKVTNDIQIIKNISTIPTVRCNKIEIEQVLVNMIENASQSFADHAKDKKIIISIYKKGKHACFEIEDNGVGIEKRNLKKIFETFYTTKITGVGTGLGLSISQDIIVNKHSGEILVDSKKNKGTIFIIKIPY